MIKLYEHFYHCKCYLQYEKIAEWIAIVQENMGEMKKLVTEITKTFYNPKSKFKLFYLCLTKLLLNFQSITFYPCSRFIISFFIFNYIDFSDAMSEKLDQNMSYYNKVIKHL